MEDLDALLQDLQATIPMQNSTNGIESPPFPNTKDTEEVNGSYSPEVEKEPAQNELSMMSLQSNLTELDSMLSSLCQVEEPEPAQQVPKVEENLDSLLQELHTTTQEQFNGSPSHRSGHGSSIQSHASATKELDDLLTSLVDFKVDDNRDSGGASVGSDKSDPSYALPDKSRNKSSSESQPQTTQKSDNDLDSVLGQLNKDLSKQGIHAASKGMCAACNKPVMGEVTTALGRVWHPEHFVCAVCDVEIGTNTFFERDGKPYCEEDYHALFSPSCAHCNHPVLGQCITALNKTWHPEHFFCAMCGNSFGDDGFHEFEGKPYCRKDYYNMFAPKCGGCNKPILSNYISALNQQWHPECFVCRECLAPFTNGSFFELDGKPYCEMHYHSIRGSLCSGCQKPITGRCINAMGKKFHPEHFLCAFCLKQLNKGTFKEQNDKPYCHQCFQKLFGCMVLQ